MAVYDVAGYSFLWKLDVIDKVDTAIAIHIQDHFLIADHSGLKGVMILKVTEVKKQEVVQVFFEDTDYYLEIEELNGSINTWLRHKETWMRMPLESIPIKFRSVESVIELAPDIMDNKHTQENIKGFKKRFLDRIPYDE